MDRKTWLKVAVAVAGVALVALSGRFISNQVLRWQGMDEKASDAILEDQSRWLTQTVQSSLDRAFEDARDVAISGGRHLPRTTGLHAVAWVEQGNVKFAWSEAARSKVLAAKVDAVESLRREILLAFSAPAPVAPDESIAWLPLATPPLFSERTEARDQGRPSRWVVAPISDVSPRSPAEVFAPGTPVALLDPALLFSEVPGARTRSQGGVYRARVIDAGSLAVLAASEPRDLSPRFRAGNAPTAVEAPEGWSPSREVLAVLKDFVALGRVSSLGTHGGIRTQVQRAARYPLLVMTERHPESQVKAASVAASGAGGKQVAGRGGGGVALVLVFLVAIPALVFARKRWLGSAWQRARARAGFSQAPAVEAELAAGGLATDIPGVESSVPVSTPRVFITTAPEDSVREDQPWERSRNSAMGEGAELAGRPTFSYAAGPQTPEVHDIESLSREVQALRTENARLRLANESLLNHQELSKRAVDGLVQREKLLQDFETGALVQRHPRVIAEQTARTAHQLCQVPALFFTVDPAGGIARLSADAGLGERGRKAPAHLEFRLDAEAMDAIADITQDGSIASLSQFEPLARLILMHFGVSHFEAWAMTGFSWLGRAAGKPSVLGVLVLLGAGSQSLTHGPSLGRMLRNAGLVYENSLLAR